MKRYFILLLLPLLFSSCATIFLGSRQKMSFDSNPPAATVIIDGKTICQTPCTEKIRKGRNTEVLFNKKGYRSRMYMISNTKGHWIVHLNYFLNFGIGYYLDMATSAAEIYTQDTIKVDLTEKPIPVSGNPSALLTAITMSGVSEGDAVGNLYKKDKKKRVIYFGPDVTFNPHSEFLQETLNKELTDLGFKVTDDEDDAKYIVKADIMDMKYKLVRESRDNYSSEANLKVEWFLYQGEELLFSDVYKGTGRWGTKGANSIERALKLTYYQFLSHPGFQDLK